MSDSEKAQSIRAWQDFAARCQVGKAERARIRQRLQQRREAAKQEGK